MDNQTNYNAETYQQPVNPQMNQYYQKDRDVMTVGDWILTLIVAMIPCVGLILYIVWALGSGENPNRRNYCRAYLIVQVIMIVLAVIVMVAFGSLITSSLS